MQENLPIIESKRLTGFILIFLFGFLSGYMLSVKVSKGIPLESYQSASANGVGMQLVRFQPEGVNYRLEICYDLPDSRDWMLTNPESPEATFIQFEEYQISPLEEGTIKWLYAADGEITGRCQYLIFVRPDPVFREITLVVNSLFSFETDYSECEGLRRKMAEKYRSVGLQCMEVMGIKGVALVQVSIEYFNDRALRNDFSDLMTMRLNGPWSFTFLIDTP